MSNKPLFELEHHLESVFPPEKWTEIRTIVAVSGGPDSIATLRAMAASALRTGDRNRSNLIVGHVNHQLRGSESDRDAQFVRELAAELGLEFHESKAQQSNSKIGKSEDSLRNFRYSQLIGLAQQLGARYLVTGHNYDDQVETILFRIFRGTGISGLSGIPRQRLAHESVTVVRPLLNVTRSEIASYLIALGQQYCTDSSNNESDYTRNYLRNELIPVLKDRFGESVSQSIARLGDQAAELEAFIESQTKPMDTAIVIERDNQIEIDCSQIRNYSPVLIRSWLNQIWIRKHWPRQSMTFIWWNKICEGICSESEVVLNLPSSIRLEKSGENVVFFDQRPKG